MQFKPVQKPVEHVPVKAPAETVKPASKQENFFRTMTTQEYKNFSAAVAQAPKPNPEAAIAAAKMIENTPIFHQTVQLPDLKPEKLAQIPEPVVVARPVKEANIPQPEPIQEELAMPQVQPWRFVGELYNTYILVEQGDDAFLIDKHAAHERILFDKLKENQEAISSQALLSPVPVRLSPEGISELLTNQALLQELGFEIDEFGENTLLLRQIPMDLSPDSASEAVESIAADLLSGRRESRDTIRDEVLHTVACKAAIKAGWVSDEKELLALVRQVMSREDLKHCPHGRPICITLSKKQLEKQFKRS
jgi:DNA mismatch repair protein MutL